MQAQLWGNTVHLQKTTTFIQNPPDWPFAADPCSNAGAEKETQRKAGLHPRPEEGRLAAESCLCVRACVCDHHILPSLPRQKVHLAMLLGGPSKRNGLIYEAENMRRGNLLSAKRERCVICSFLWADISPIPLPLGYLSFLSVQIERTRSPFLR